MASAIQSGETGLELRSARLHVALQRGHAVARPLQPVNRLARRVDRREIGGARAAQLLERGARRIECRAQAQRVERHLPGAAARVGARAECVGRRDGGEATGVERVDADLARGELQRRNLEAVGPLPRFGQHAPGDSLP